jgi:hypothetical protein
LFGDFSACAVNILKLSALRRLFSLPAAMFYCLATLMLYDRMGSPQGVPAIAAILASFLFSGSIALWVLADVQHGRRPVPYDFGSFVFFAWWALVPIYLFSTRGWRGLVPLGWFILLYVAAAVLGSMPVWLLALRP